MLERPICLYLTQVLGWFICLFLGKYSSTWAALRIHSPSIGAFINRSLSVSNACLSVSPNLKITSFLVKSYKGFVIIEKFSTNFLKYEHNPRKLRLGCFAGLEILLLLQGPDQSVGYLSWLLCNLNEMNQGQCFRTHSVVSYALLLL